jgi:hypothetical protein
MDMPKFIKYWENITLNQLVSLYIVSIPIIFLLISNDWIQKKIVLYYVNKAQKQILKYKKNLLILNKMNYENKTM